MLPRLEERYARQVDDGEWQGYKQRLERHFSRLFGLLYRLYGQQYDFFYHLESILLPLRENPGYRSIQGDA